MRSLVSPAFHGRLLGRPSGRLPVCVAGSSPALLFGFESAREPPGRHGRLCALISCIVRWVCFFHALAAVVNVNWSSVC